MFLAERLWPIFLSHLRVNQLISQSIHRFDDAEQKVVVSGPSTILVYKLKLGVSILFILAICIQVIAYRKCFSTVVLAQSIFFCVSYGSHAMISRATLKKSADLATLVNAMLDMERKFNGKIFATISGIIIKPFCIEIRQFSPHKTVFY